MDVKKLAMMGCGSMGGGMALLYAEHGVSVSLYDPSSEVMDNVIQSAKDQGIETVPSKYEDYKSLCSSLDSPKVFVLSLPHGKTGDEVIEGLHPYMDKGDFIIDCANEHWTNSERRQGKMLNQGVYYIGMGVSGGYQSARRGPSMSPGGDDKALDLIMPFLEKVASKDARGKPCVGKVGQGGAGHYVKMIHNGIEHGMMSAISESWEIMNTHLGMSYDEIGGVFEKWNSVGELKNTFLISIAAEISEKKNKQGQHVLAEVQDKVVQDVDNEEGTGVWSNEEAINKHVPAPTLSTAHFLRIVSANRAQREHVKSTFHGSFLPSKIKVQNEPEKEEIIEDLRWAVYTTCLASFVQGMGIINAADQQYRWSINYQNVVQIWRAGCIISADHIADLLDSVMASSDSIEASKLLFHRNIVEELKTGYPHLKKIVLKATEANAVIPSISATLEYLKYCGSLDLPTQFYEAELDFFGKHKYDKKGEGPGEPAKGKYHYEWKPA